MAYSAPTNYMPPKVATAYQSAAAIVPTDATPIGPFAALYVGVTGDVALVPRNATAAVVFKAVPAGTVLPVAFHGVDATNTTATNLVGLG